MDTEIFIIHIKTDDFYEDNADDVEKRFDTSNYEVNRPLPIEKNKKVIRLIKDELEGKIMTKFVTIRPKSYYYLMDDVNSNKRVQGIKKCVIKRITKFNDYKNYLFMNEIKLYFQRMFKSEAHNVYTKEINKIVLNGNDDKRLQTFDNITTCPYGTNAFKVNKTDLLERLNTKWLILMIIQITIKQSIIQSGHIFQIIDTEY